MPAIDRTTVGLILLVIISVGTVGRAAEEPEQVDWANLKHVLGWPRSNHLNLTVPPGDRRC